jgi:hypothetical protein
MAEISQKNPTLFEADRQTMTEAIRAAFAKGENSGESTHFKFICYQKGTLHLTFKNLDILRRFNVVACRGKGWLPGDYGAKPYDELSHSEQKVADAFEGETQYQKFVSRPLFAAGKTMMIGGI